MSDHPTAPNGRPTTATLTMVARAPFSSSSIAMLNDVRKPIDSAGPSTPIELLGLDGVADAGEILNVADITSTVTFFNGDDALVLTRNGVIIDMLGIVGNRPASGEWGTGSVTTKYHSIRRLPLHRRSL